MLRRNCSTAKFIIPAIQISGYDTTFIHSFVDFASMVDNKCGSMKSHLFQSLLLATYVFSFSLIFPLTITFPMSAVRPFVTSVNFAKSDLLFILIHVVGLFS